MQLDRTEIVVRQRSSLELLDLSLVVLRKHARQIMATSALFAIPMLVIDVLMTQWMLSDDALLVAEDLENPRLVMRWRQGFHLVMLYALQFPLVSLPTTVFLGNRVFFEPIGFRDLFERLKPIAWRCIVVLGIFRLGLVCLVMEAMVDRSVIWDIQVETWFFAVLGLVILALRAGWPFAPEILGLELCPLLGKKGKEITYRQRSRGLHSMLLGEHVSRYFGATSISILLSLMFLSAALFCQGVFTGSWLWGDWLNLFVLPVILWAVGLFLTVYRFLCYLDTRIRLEGWEIELRLKAEASRIQSTKLQPDAGDESLESERVAT